MDENTQLQLVESNSSVCMLQRPTSFFISILDTCQYVENKYCFDFNFRNRKYTFLFDF